MKKTLSYNGLYTLAQLLDAYDLTYNEYISLRAILTEHLEDISCNYFSRCPYANHLNGNNKCDALKKDVEIPTEKNMAPMDKDCPYRKVKTIINKSYY